MTTDSSDDAGNMWYSQDYDHSAWTAATSFSPDAEEYGHVDPYMNSVVPGAQWVGITQTTSADCTNGDVKLSEYPTGNPYLYYNGEWVPICGHYWWDNNHGCTTICSALGYTSGTRQHTRTVYDVNSIEVGKCNAGEDILSCTMAHNFYTETSWSLLAIRLETPAPVLSVPAAPRTSAPRVLPAL